MGMVQRCGQDKKICSDSYALINQVGGGGGGGLVGFEAGHAKK